MIRDKVVATMKAFKKTPKPRQEGELVAGIELNSGWKEAASIMVDGHMVVYVQAIGNGGEVELHLVPVEPDDTCGCFIESLPAKGRGARFRLQSTWAASQFAPATE